MFIGGKEISLLRRVFLSDKKEDNFIYTNPYYIPLKTRNIHQINIYLTDRDGNLNSFLDGRVTVTLHVSDPMIWETFKKNLIHTLINQNSMGEDFTKENRMQSL